MSAPSVEQRLRLFLLGLAGLMCVGTTIELAFSGHTKRPIQYLPFALCGLGLAVILGVLLRPQRGTIWALRSVMAAIVLGGFLGMYEHVRSNLELVMEVRPDTALATALWKSLGSAAPLLAPGILGLIALIAVAATYSHPALGNRPGAPSLS